MAAEFLVDELHTLVEPHFLRSDTTQEAPAMDFSCQGSFFVLLKKQSVLLERNKEAYGFRHEAALGFIPSCRPMCFLSLSPRTEPLLGQHNALCRI